MSIATHLLMDKLDRTASSKERLVTAQSPPPGGDWQLVAPALMMTTSAHDQDVIRNVVATLGNALGQHPEWENANPPAYIFEALSSDPLRVAFWANRNHPDFLVLRALGQQADRALQNIGQQSGPPARSHSSNSYIRSNIPSGSSRWVRLSHPSVFLFNGHRDLSFEVDPGVQVERTYQEFADHFMNHVAERNDWQEGVDYFFRYSNRALNDPNFFLNPESPHFTDILEVFMRFEMNLRNQLHTTTEDVRTYPLWPQHVIQAIFLPINSEANVAMIHGSLAWASSQFFEMLSRLAQAYGVAVNTPPEAMVSYGPCRTIIEVRVIQRPQRFYQQITNMISAFNLYGGEFVNEMLVVLSPTTVSNVVNTFRRSISTFLSNVDVPEIQEGINPSVNGPEHEPEPELEVDPAGQPREGTTFNELFQIRDGENTIEYEIRQHYNDLAKQRLEEAGFVEGVDYWIGNGEISWVRGNDVVENIVNQMILYDDRSVRNALRAYRLDRNNRELLVSILGEDVVNELFVNANLHIKRNVEQIVGNQDSPFGQFWGEEFWSEHLDAIMREMSTNGDLETFMSSSNRVKLCKIRRAVTNSGVIPGYSHRLIHVGWFSTVLQTVGRNENVFRRFQQAAEDEGLQVFPSRFHVGERTDADQAAAYDSLVGMNAMDALSVNRFMAEFAYNQMVRGGIRVSSDNPTPFLGVVSAICTSTMIDGMRHLPIFNEEGFFEKFVKTFFVGHILEGNMNFYTGAYGGVEGDWGNVEIFLERYNTPDKLLQSPFGESVYEALERVMYDALDGFAHEQGR